MGSRSVSSLKMICFCKINLAEHNFWSHLFVIDIRKRFAVYNFLFVYGEELKWSIQGYYFWLLANQLKVPTSRSGVNVRAHLLSKNYSRNFSSIRNAP